MIEKTYMEICIIYLAFTVTLDLHNLIAYIHFASTGKLHH